MAAADSGILQELIQRYGCDGEAKCRAVLEDGAATVDQLADALYQESVPLRAIAIVLLGELGDHRAVAPLMSLLQDPHTCRPAFSDRLGYRLARLVSPYLRRLERHTAQMERVVVRRTAASALARLGDRRAVHALEAIRDDPDEGVRKAVQEARTRLGAGGGGTQTTL